VALNANVSRDLLCAISSRRALHDGAVILQGEQSRRRRVFCR